MFYKFWFFFFDEVEHTPRYLYKQRYWKRFWMIEQLFCRWLVLLSSVFYVTYYMSSKSPSKNASKLIYILLYSPDSVGSFSRVTKVKKVNVVSPLWMEKKFLLAFLRVHLGSQASFFFLFFSFCRVPFILFLVLNLILFLLN